MKYFYLAIIQTLLLLSCTEKIIEEEMQNEQITDHVIVTHPLVNRDLSEIKEDGTLKAIMVYSGISYFLYRGKPMGYEYELLQRLANHLDVKLEVVLANDINDLINMLNRGEGDVIAHGLTVTQRRKEFVNFMDYLYLTHQVLVQKKPDNWREMKLHEIQKTLINDPIELIDETVSVRRNSAYYSRLVNLQKEIGGGININIIPGNVSTQKAIRMVVDGEIKLTVADNNIAELNSAYYPILDVKTPVSFSQRVSWATRKNAPELQQELNNWVKTMRKDVDYYVIYNKYFENKRLYKKRTSSEFHSENSGRISPYDSLIQLNAKIIGWDWKLVTALIYQESRFDPNEKSWAGARGLMQLMPSTAEELGVSNIFNPEQNIQAGSKYLKKLWIDWNEIPDSIQRIKFTLASYNCGFYHVKDAQRLAKKFDKDPKMWSQNVETYLLNLSLPEFYNDEVVHYGYVMGEEPINYVNQIIERYEHYKNLLTVYKTTGHQINGSPVLD